MFAVFSGVQCCGLLVKFGECVCWIWLFMPCYSVNSGKCCFSHLWRQVLHLFFFTRFFFFFFLLFLLSFPFLVDYILYIIHDASNLVQHQEKRSWSPLSGLLLLLPTAECAATKLKRGSLAWCQHKYFGYFDCLLLCSFVYLYSCGDCI